MDGTVSCETCYICNRRIAVDNTLQTDFPSTLESGVPFTSAQISTYTLSCSQGVVGREGVPSLFSCFRLQCNESEYLLNTNLKMGLKCC